MKQPISTLRHRPAKAAGPGPNRAAFRGSSRPQFSWTLRLRDLRFLTGAAVLLLGLACEPSDRPTPPAPAPPPEPASGYPIVELSIGIHRLRAEVADTLPRRAQGLSGRRTLAQGEGMIFPYDPPEQPSFWMPDMHFDIDIVWIRQGKIIDLHSRVPHQVERPLPTYAPSAPIDWVLEVPAGTAEAQGWRVGDPVLSDPEPIFRDRR